MIARSNFDVRVGGRLVSSRNCFSENRAVEMSAAWLRLTYASFAAMTFGKDFL
jgi:hypothetical protein